MSCMQPYVTRDGSVPPSGCSVGNATIPRIGVEQSPIRGYVPKPGSISARVIALLQSKPGAEWSSGELAIALDRQSDLRALAACLASAVRAGAISRRLVQRQGSLRAFLWKLGPVPTVAVVDAVEDSCDLPIVQRSIKAGAVPPLRVSGPRSVFDLGTF